MLLEPPVSASTSSPAAGFTAGVSPPVVAWPVPPDAWPSPAGAAVLTFAPVFASSSPWPLCSTDDFAAPLAIASSDGAVGVLALCASTPPSFFDSPPNVTSEQA